MQELWKSTSNLTKIVMLGGIGLVVAISMALYLWATSIHYVALYNDVAEQDAAQIVKVLADSKFDYRLDNGGKTILVNEQQVGDIRLSIAGKHLPLSGGMGFELFDNVNYGMTEFVQNINYQRALQGELSRTIATLPDIKAVRVHLVLPNESLFQKNKHKRTASVTLTVLPGKVLSSEQVASIQHLVAASVEAMDANNVLILDESGSTLSRTDDADGLNLGANFQFKKQVEDYLAYKAAKVVEAALGNKSGYVYVDADINFDEVNVTQEIYSPEAAGKGIIAKSKVITSFRENSAEHQESRNAAKQETSEYEYKVNKSIEQIMHSKGGLQRLSISVVLPQGIEAAVADSIKQLVMASIGYSEARGDQISIQSLAVPTTGKMENVDNTSPQDKQPGFFKTMTHPTANPVSANMLWTGIAMLAVLMMVLIMALMALKQAKTTAKPLSTKEKERLLADVKAWLHS